MQHGVQEGEEEEEGRQSKATDVKPSIQKSKTRSYLDRVDAEHKRHFGLRNILIGVIVASAAIVVIELMINGIV